MPVGSLRYIAETTVNRERKHGRLRPQPCEVCGAEKAIAHHEDYRRPLDLTWLCKPHHQLRHSEINLALFGRKQVGFPYAWVFEFGLDRCRKLAGRDDIATFPAKRAFLKAA